MVEYALYVVFGLNEPHEFAGEQLQDTPPFAASFVTFAEMFAVPPTWIVEGGGDQKPMATFDGTEDEELPPPQPAKSMSAKMTTAKLFQFMITP